MVSLSVLLHLQLDFVQNWFILRQYYSYHQYITLATSVFFLFQFPIMTFCNRNILLVAQEQKIQKIYKQQKMVGGIASCCNVAASIGQDLSEMLQFLCICTQADAKSLSPLSKVKSISPRIQINVNILESEQFEYFARCY